MNCSRCVSCSGVVGERGAECPVVACDVADHPWTEVESVDTIKSVDIISGYGRFPSGAVNPELSGMPVVCMAKVCLEAGILLRHCWHTMLFYNNSCCTFQLASCLKISKKNVHFKSVEIYL